MNRAVHAAAGSRKTSYVVKAALGHSKNEKVLILTYTLGNLDTIKDYLLQIGLSIPPNITIQSWYSFLLSDGVRPYQNTVYNEARISGILFMEGRSAIGRKKKDVRNYYFSSDGRIYTDKISEYACRCESETDGAVIYRLEHIYDHIYIDEVQDLAGYDFDFLELLLLSKINITLVGDSRQATYFTNCSPKNRKFRGKNIINLFKDWENRGLCTLNEKNESYRSNQLICDFSDKLYPTLARTISQNRKITGHDGVFIIGESDVPSYVEAYEPQVLRDTVKANTFGFSAMNFGLAKGKSFDRVLVIPNGPLKSFLKNGDADILKDQTRAKLYVAVTRARYSVAIVYDETTIFREIGRFEKS